MNDRKKTKKLTVRFSKRLKAEMLNALIKSGYGLRGKSKWIAESIHLLLKQNNFIELAEQGIDINQAELIEVEAFYLDIETIHLIKKALIEIRVKYPLFEGVQSAIVRAAVIYRLMLAK
jgi:hypothetical protein